MELKIPRNQLRRKFDLLRLDKTARKQYLEETSGFFISQVQKLQQKNQKIEENTKAGCSKSFWLEYYIKLGDEWRKEYQEMMQFLRSSGGAIEPYEQFFERSVQLLSELDGLEFNLRNNLLDEIKDISKTIRAQDSELLIPQNRESIDAMKSQIEGSLKEMDIEVENLGINNVKGTANNKQKVLQLIKDWQYKKSTLASEAPFGNQENLQRCDEEISALVSGLNAQFRVSQLKDPVCDAWTSEEENSLSSIVQHLAQKSQERKLNKDDFEIASKMICNKSVDETEEFVRWQKFEKEHVHHYQSALHDTQQQIRQTTAEYTQQYKTEHENFLQNYETQLQRTRLEIQSLLTLNSLFSQNEESSRSQLCQQLQQIDDQFRKVDEQMQQQQQKQERERFKKQKVVEYNLEKTRKRKLLKNAFFAWVECLWEKRKKRAVLNSERVDFRKEKMQEKFAQQELKLQMESEMEEARQRRLQRLRSLVKVNVENDIDRAIGPTQSSQAYNQENDALNDQIVRPFKPVYGYDDRSLLKDKKFRVFEALCSKGLNSYKYAGEVLKNFNASNR